MTLSLNNILSTRGFLVRRALKRIVVPAMLAMTTCFVSGNSVKAQAFLDVRFNNEIADTLKINSILSDPAVINADNPSARMAVIGRKFVGIPYKAHTLERVPEKVTVNLDSLDCTTFVETVMALAKTVGEERESWRDFVYNLRNIRYRGGNVNGYPSRLHYISDWAIDNAHRDNFIEVTQNLPKVKWIVRTIDFMTRHRNAYTALADSANYERIKDVEGAYRSHRFPYIKSVDLGAKEVVAKLRDGDAVAFVTNMNDLDVTHLGMIVKEDDGLFHVLHASMSNGQVEVSKIPLTEFMRRNRSFLGIRVFRLK